MNANRRITRCLFRAALVLVLVIGVSGPLSGKGLAQTSSGLAPGTLYGPIPGTEARTANAYRYFTYPNIDLWTAVGGAGNQAKAAPIAAWITAHQKDTRPQYAVKDRYKGIANFVGTPDYNWKTESISDPDITEPLARMGLKVDIREGGGFYIVVAPKKVVADKTRRVPILYAPYVLDKKDVFWAMNTLVSFRKYNDLCAQRGDFIIIYLLVEKSAGARGGGLSGTLIDTAFDAYQGDYKRIYFDMSVFAENGAKVADVPGLNWSDDDGTKRECPRGRRRSYDPSQSRSAARGRGIPRRRGG